MARFDNRDRYAMAGGGRWNRKDGRRDGKSGEIGSAETAAVRLGPATAMPGGVTAGVSDEGNAQAQDPPQCEALPVQPAPPL
jgi:hypothetical protein